VMWIGMIPYCVTGAAGQAWQFISATQQRNSPTP
jgi:hypothetical protein